MFLDLQGCAGCLAAVVAARMRRRGVPGLGVLSVLARGRTEVAIERERRATLALVLGCLPAGWCVIDRDPCGRERFIGPVAAAPARSVKGALW
jgi:hypothetical protein